MRALLGYDARMLRWSAVLAFLLAAGLMASVSAQINGVPPSVTSFGFGGHAFPNAPRPSVTSLGPSSSSGPHHGIPPNAPLRPGHNSPYTYPYYPSYYPYSVIDPTVYGGPMNGADLGNEDDEYMGGPTVFDRRGNGQYYRPDGPANATPPASPANQADAAYPISDAPPEPPQPDTVLVFKDGHKQQVSNYAIVGANLFDLSSGRRQKIAISDLDVAATQKANEDQGIDFRLPTGS
jgi:hypothetical protein